MNGPDFTVVYDGENGEVHVDYGTGIEQAIEVRQSMVDQAVRHAAVVELERLGYRVIAPEDYEVEMQWAAVESGYEDQVGDYYTARGSAEFDVKMNKTAGLHSHLAAREVIYGPWKGVQS